MCRVVGSLLVDQEAVVATGNKLSMTLVKVRLEGACHLWRKIPSRQLSIDLEADERFGWVTGRAEAS